MIGAVIIAVVIVVLIPVGFLMSMAAPAAIIGGFLKSTAESDAGDSELVETNY